MQKMASGPTLLVVDNYPPYTDIPRLATFTSVVTVLDQQLRTPVTPDVMQVTVHPENTAQNTFTYGMGTSITQLSSNSYQFVMQVVAQAGLLLLTWVASSNTLGVTGSVQSKLNVIEELL
jgi:hypothetical protein